MSPSDAHLQLGLRITEANCPCMFPCWLPQFRILVEELWWGCGADDSDTSVAGRAEW